MRRKAENNSEVVYEILQEVATALLDKRPVNYDPRQVNDTLYHLAMIDRVHTHLDTDQALDYFRYLTSISMHASAYNLLFESHKVESSNLDRDSLVKQLKTDTRNCCPMPWIMDNTK